MIRTKRWIRFQTAIIICYAVAIVGALVAIVGSDDKFGRVLMMLVSASIGFSLYIDVRKYIDARRGT